MSFISKFLRYIFNIINTTLTAVWIHFKFLYKWYAGLFIFLFFLDSCLAHMTWNMLPNVHIFRLIFFTYTFWVLQLDDINITLYALMNVPERFDEYLVWQSSTFFSEVINYEILASSFYSTVNLVFDSTEWFFSVFVLFFFFLPRDIAEKFSKNSYKKKKMNEWRRTRKKKLINKRLRFVIPEILFWYFAFFTFFFLGLIFLFRFIFNCVFYLLSMIKIKYTTYIYYYSGRVADEYVYSHPRWFLNYVWLLRTFFTRHGFLNFPYLETDDIYFHKWIFLRCKFGKKKKKEWIVCEYTQEFFKDCVLGAIQYSRIIYRKQVYLKKIFRNLYSILCSKQQVSNHTWLFILYIYIYTKSFAFFLLKYWFNVYSLVNYWLLKYSYSIKFLTNSLFITGKRWIFFYCNKLIFWRSLFKRWSYIGLYSRTRINWIQFTNLTTGQKKNNIGATIIYEN